MVWWRKIIEIKLTNSNNVAYIDDEDYGLVSPYNWYENDSGYAVTNIDKKKVRMHRLIMGVSDSVIHIDHINHLRLFNCRDNLRICNNKENIWNRGGNKNSTSKYRGVSFYNGKWIAQIEKDDKGKVLGRFFTEEAAAIAYNKKSIEYFGKFAYQNEIDFTEEAIYKREEEFNNSQIKPKYIYKQRNKWTAEKRHKGKLFYFGTYNTQEEALFAVTDGIRCLQCD